MERGSNKDGGEKNLSLFVRARIERRKEGGGEVVVLFLHDERESLLRNVDKAETKGGRRWFELKILGCVNSRW